MAEGGYDPIENRRRFEEGRLSEVYKRKAREAGRTFRERRELRPLALPDAHGLHGKCLVEGCGWEGKPGQSRGRALGELARHHKSAHESAGA